MRRQEHIAIHSKPIVTKIIGSGRRTGRWDVDHNRLNVTLGTAPKQVEHERRKWFREEVECDGWKVYKVVQSRSTVTVYKVVQSRLNVTVYKWSIVG